MTETVTVGVKREDAGTTREEFFNLARGALDTLEPTKYSFILIYPNVDGDDDTAKVMASMPREDLIAVLRNLANDLEFGVREQ